jgi:tetratricopeptide (TPR) repeat protein
MESAEDLNERGLALSEQGDALGAEAAYRAAMAADPSWAAPCYNLGLLYKYQSRWPESLEFNQRAASLDDQHEAAWWNLGIAATALGNWSEARRAWVQCGMKPPPGDGPPDFNFGSTPVRLDPNGDGEVVWAHRIDPARAEILSVPLPESPHNAGAIVLTDGAADGYRKIGEVEYPVFNVLMVLQPSTLRKYIIELAAVGPSAMEVLERLAADLGGAAEDWGRSINILCAKCSRGLPHEHAPTPDHPAHPHCGLAARDDDHAEAIIHAWLECEPRADLIRWYAAGADAA